MATFGPTALNNIQQRQHKMELSIAALMAMNGATGGFNDNLNLNGHDLIETGAVQLQSADASEHELTLDANKNLIFDNNILLTNNNYPDYIPADNLSGWRLGTDVVIDSDNNFTISGTSPFNYSATRTDNYYGIQSVGYVTITEAQNNIGIGLSMLPLRTKPDNANVYGEGFIDAGVMANNGYLSAITDGLYVDDSDFLPLSYPVNITMIYDGESTIKFLFNGELLTQFIFTVPKGNYCMTLGGFQGTVTNPTFVAVTPSNDPTTWSSFPALTNVSLNSNAISNCSSINAPTVYLGSNNAGGFNTLTTVQASGKNNLTYNTSDILTESNYTDIIPISTFLTGISSNNGTVGIYREGSDVDLALNFSFTENLDMGGNELIGVQSIQIKSNDAVVSNDIIIDSEAGFLSVKRQGDDSTTGSRVFDERYNPVIFPPLTIIADIDMQTYNVINATSITAGDLYATNDFHGLGVSLPYTRVCNTGTGDLVLTKDNGVHVGVIYDDYYHVPPTSNAYSSSVNIGAANNPATDGYDITTVQNLSLVQFDYGDIQCSRSNLIINGFNMTFSLTNDGAYTPSSFIVTLSLGNVDTNGAVIGETVTWSFTVVGMTANSTYMYRLPTNVNQVISNLGISSAAMSMNLTVKGPVAPTGQAYVLFLTAFNITGILDGYMSLPLVTTATAIGLNQS